MFSMLGIAGLALAMAQQPSMARTDQDGSVLVTATLGHGKTWDDEGSIGSGLSAGGSVEWRFHPRLSAAFRVERLGHERHTSGDFLVFTGRTIFATGEIKYRFTSAGVAPYVAGGYGAVVYSGTLTSNFGPPGTIRRSSQSGTFVGGGGIEIPLGTRFVIAPEVRLFMCQPKDDFAPWAAIRGGVSAGWRF